MFSILFTSVTGLEKFHFYEPMGTNVITGITMSANKLRIQKIVREESDTRRLGIKVKYMCLSLSCEQHQALHGELFDIHKIKTLYDLANVPTDCRCAVTQVLIDDQGNPLMPTVVERAKAQAASSKKL